ncbi:MAG: nicotinate-nucleotide diphosphorylase (carboxylating), partial [Oscillospiraceae bacterium]|nr:nicotinate-nucleotide diphosphorylase (carboxylating) [Oscillospiraceae bacterium]
MMNALLVDDLILMALKEDMPLGDITTDLLIPEEAPGKAYLKVKDPGALGYGILAGLDVAARVFGLLDPSTIFRKEAEDGSKAYKGQIVACIEG